MTTWPWRTQFLRRISSPNEMKVWYRKFEPRPETVKGDWPHNSGVFLCHTENLRFYSLWPRQYVAEREFIKKWRSSFFMNSFIKNEGFMKQWIIHEWMNGWMNRWMDEWMNGWMLHEILPEGPSQRQLREAQPNLAEGLILFGLLSHSEYSYSDRPLTVKGFITFTE